MDYPQFKRSLVIQEWMHAALQSCTLLSISLINQLLGSEATKKRVVIFKAYR